MTLCGDNVFVLRIPSPQCNIKMPTVIVNDKIIIIQKMLLRLHHIIQCYSYLTGFNVHQHVHLRRESQSHAPAHVLMRLYPIDKSLICLQSKRRMSC
jgi:hypothetical protein